MIWYWFTQDEHTEWPSFSISVTGQCQRKIPCKLFWHDDNKVMTPLSFSFPYHFVLLCESSMSISMPRFSSNGSDAFPLFLVSRLKTKVMEWQWNVSQTAFHTHLRFLAGLRVRKCSLWGQGLILRMNSESDLTVNGPWFCSFHLPTLFGEWSP